MLFDEGPIACPFVALENDRDRRSAEPDPRHRCYAEPTPAPRALAHQREFCLSPTFGGCPIFQDWAIRAAARPVPLRPPVERPPFDDDPAAVEQLPVFAPPPASGPPAAGPAEPEPIERIASMPLEAQGNPAAEGEAGADEPAGVDPAGVVPASAEAARDDDQPADELADEQRADRRRRWQDDWPPAAAATGTGSGHSLLADDGPPEEAPLPAFLAGRDEGRPARQPELPRQVDYAQRHEPPARPQPRPSSRDQWSAQRVDLIPSWERQRYAASPTIGTRLGLGDSGELLGRLTKLFAVAALIALLGALLILAPSFLGGIGAPAVPTPSPTPTVAASPTPPPTPTPTPEPTTVTHTIAPGDTLFGIAVQYGVTVEQILAANPQITNPNLIQVGQVIVIPPDDFPVPTPPRASPSP
jgi:nucleoid-associated protein YgaU